MDERKFVTYDQIEYVRCDKDERETTINSFADEDKWTIFSSDNKTITRIKRAMKRYPGEYICWEGTRDSENNISGYFFECGKRAIKFARNSKIKRSKLSGFAKTCDSTDEEESDEE